MMQVEVADQIDVDDLAPERRVGVDKIHHPVPACVVDQDADSADFVFDARDRGRDGGMVGDVDREGGGCAAGKANAFFGARCVEIEHGEPATLFREAQRDGRPMPLPPPVTRAT
jgi:hypothetical protein